MCSTARDVPYPEGCASPTREAPHLEGCAALKLACRVNAASVRHARKRAAPGARRRGPGAAGNGVHRRPRILGA